MVGAKRASPSAVTRHPPRKNPFSVTSWPVQHPSCSTVSPCEFRNEPTAVAPAAAASQPGSSPDIVALTCVVVLSWPRSSDRIKRTPDPAACPAPTPPHPQWCRPASGSLQIPITGTPCRCVCNTIRHRFRAAGRGRSAYSYCPAGSQISVSQRFRAANIAYAHIQLRRQAIKIRKVKRICGSCTMAIVEVSRGRYRDIYRFAARRHLHLQITSSHGIPRTGTPVSDSICSIPE